MSLQRKCTDFGNLNQDSVPLKHHPTGKEGTLQPRAPFWKGLAFLSKPKALTKRSHVGVGSLLQASQQKEAEPPTPPPQQKKKVQGWFWARGFLVWGFRVQGSFSRFWYWLILFKTPQIGWPVEIETLLQASRRKTRPPNTTPPPRPLSGWPVASCGPRFLETRSASVSGSAERQALLEPSRRSWDGRRGGCMEHPDYFWGGWV